MPNYFDHKKKARKLSKKHSSRPSSRFGLMIFLFLLIALVAVYFLFFSSVFKINNIIVEAGGDVLENEIREQVSSLALGKNFFLFSQKDISQELAKDFRIQDITIDKIFPHSLKISFKRSWPFAKLYIRGGEENFLYRKNNQIYVAPRKTFDEYTIAMMNPNITTIYDKTDLGIKTKEWQDLFVDLAHILSLYGLGNKQNFNINFIEIKEEAGKITLDITTNKGWKIFADSQDLKEQFQRIKVILDEIESKDDLSSIDYIDLRYGETVFYK